MMSVYKDGCLYGDRIFGSFVAWKFCMGRRLRNKQSECVANLTGSSQSVVVCCFSTVILGIEVRFKGSIITTWLSRMRFCSTTFQCIVIQL